MPHVNIKDRTPKTQKERPLRDITNKLHSKPTKMKATIVGPKNTVRILRKEIRDTWINGHDKPSTTDKIILDLTSIMDPIWTEPTHNQIRSVRRRPSDPNSIRKKFTIPSSFTRSDFSA